LFRHYFDPSGKNQQAGLFPPRLSNRNQLISYFLPFQAGNGQTTSLAAEPEGQMVTYS
jgi:hypothetical protein